MRSIITALLVMIPLLIIGEENMEFKKLTKEEERVIIHKGTERPFTGEYNKHYEDGTYNCKRCGTALYRSDSKFDSGCGWPSFDDEIEGAVMRISDADGVRTEIVCANCGAHLGHVFTGEQFTSKNTRHCVNSISLDFVPNTQKAIFAGGCFWGVEHLFQKVDGVLGTSVGYIGGDTQNPSYKEVCSGTTGHTEAIQITYDPGKVSYEELVKLFFEIHDFTQVNRQGPDIGEQYRSAIFYTNPEQTEISRKIMKQLAEMNYRVATALVEASKFWKADEYHQDYYDKTGKSPYCHIRKKIFE